ncbi:MAG TPA: hypothetical protein DEO60_11395 [Bacteroidales bacterium]|nr:hypothetical protein [Bacteroidales bacterium]HBZ21723.1 hypothetical protein [Bacteroidales bacterium]
MLETITLPPELESHVGTEIKDFAVKAKHAAPPKAALAMIIFGVVWLAFSSVFLFAFLGPLFKGEEVHFLANDVPTVASPENLRPILLPAAIIGIFILIGLGMLGGGIFMMFKKGGYFIGTQTRLISLQKGKYRSVDWEQFSGDIEVTGNEQKGNIKLGLRSGKMISSKNGPDRYVPDEIYISGIQNVSEIEESCRKRIKENDPTPAVRS